MLFVSFKWIWVSCGSWELTKHTNKQQTLQKKISQSPTQLTDNVHLLELGLGLGLGLGLDLFLSFLGSCLLAGLVLLLVLVFWYLLACWVSPIIHHLPWPHFHFLTRSQFVIFPHNSCSLSYLHHVYREVTYLHHVYREVNYLYCMCCI